jgi:trigger factor
LDFNVNDINETEKEIQINITQEELVPHFEEAFKEYQRKVELPGFRKGKVPMHMIKKIYGESIEYEKLEKLADNFFRKVTEEQNINPIGTPALVDMDYKRGETAMYRIKYEVNPSFELKEYKGMTFEKEVHKVTEREVEEEIKHILSANATFEETQTATDETHVVIYDMEYLDETGTIVVGDKVLNQRINLSDDHLLEFKNALINSSVGDEPIVNFEMAHEGHQHKYSVRLIVKKIERIIPPEFSDELVKKITKEKVTSISEFKAQLEKDIQAYWHDINDRKLRDSIVEKIISSYEFTVPHFMVDNLLESYIDRLKEKYPKKELPTDFDIEKYKKENHENAVWQVKWYFISQRIIEAENINIEDAELEKLVEADVERTGIDKERLLQYYKNSQSLKDKLLTNKLMTFLIMNNNIIEKIKE